MKATRRFRYSVAVVLVAAVAIWTADRAWAQRLILRQSKGELKLKYDVSVRDLGNGRIFVRFALADDGRLKPVRSVDLEIPGTDKDKNGGISPELSVRLGMSAADGKQATQFELTKELAQRAEIRLMSPLLDGKHEGCSGFIYIIPIAKYMNGVAPAAPDARPKVPAATERTN